MFSYDNWTQSTALNLSFDWTLFESAEADGPKALIIKSYSMNSIVNSNTMKVRLDYA